MTPLWNDILGRIETKVNRYSFYTWFKPTSFVADGGSSITVRVPNALFKDWLTKHYSVVLSEALPSPITVTWLPDASIAETEKTCSPGASPSIACGEVHGAKSGLLGSNWHSKRAFASDVKLRVGVVSAVGLDGSGGTTEAAGATVSTVMASGAESRFGSPLILAMTRCAPSPSGDPPKPRWSGVITRQCGASSSRCSPE